MGDDARGSVDFSRSWQDVYPVAHGTSPPQNCNGIQAYLSPPSQLPRMTDDQLTALENHFGRSRNPSDLDIAILAAEVGLPENQVKRWFEHRLARWRQQQGLPANSGSIK